VNYLALCQRACVECGVASGQAILSALPTTDGASGSVGRVVNWVGDAWNDIQRDHDDWDWMRSSVLLGGGVTVATIAGQASYPLGTGAGTVGVAVDAFGKWDRETFRAYPTATGFQGEDYLDEVPFDTWRDSYMFGAMRSVQTRPVVVAVGPDESLCLGPPPDGNYTVTADYFVAPSEMVADTDIPVGLPTRFHLLIVYQAMIKYAGYESAPEVEQRGASESARMLAQLMALRAPRIGFGGALA
jgi:hypothetical protein